uniref:Uncharacterized protein n=1 Tax=Kalanchoe fedtschenkoi TaxID=63787 RepID=A0A7N0SWH1_KALFE
MRRFLVGFISSRSDIQFVQICVILKFIPKITISHPLDSSPATSLTTSHFRRPSISLCFSLLCSPFLVLLFFHDSIDSSI